MNRRALRLILIAMLSTAFTWRAAAT